MKDFLFARDGRVSCFVQFVLYLAVFFAARFVLQMIIGFPIGKILSGSFDGDVQAIVNSTSYHAMSLITLTVINFAVSIVLIILFLRLNNCSLECIGITSFNKSRRELLLGFGVGVIFAVLISLFYFILGGARYSFSGFSILTILNLLFYISVAAVETVLVRGILQHLLYINSMTLLGLFLPALAYALLYFVNVGMYPLAIINMILSGILLSMITFKMSNVFMAFASQVGYLFFIGCIMGLGVRGEAGSPLFYATLTKSNALNGGVYGSEGGLIFTILVIIAAAAVIFLLKPFNDNKAAAALKRKLTFRTLPDNM